MANQVTRRPLSKNYVILILHILDALHLYQYLVLFVFGATTSSGPGPPHSRGFYITHNDAPQSVGLLWTSDQLVAETST